ncbi:MAG: PAS domain S-box protein [Flammeovirgaceae bacterium]|nr:PAS domain S-box protein [Flammeovirgaceae bacterium]
MNPYMTDDFFQFLSQKFKDKEEDQMVKIWLHVQSLDENTYINCINIINRFNDNGKFEITVTHSGKTFKKDPTKFKLSQPFDQALKDKYLLKTKDHFFLSEASKKHIKFSEKGLNLAFYHTDIDCFIADPKDLENGEKQNQKIIQQIALGLASDGLAVLLDSNEDILSKSSFFSKIGDNLFRKTGDNFPTNNSELLAARALVISLQSELKQKDQEFEQLNNEIEAYNHELEASNEELRATNDEIVSTYSELYKSNEALKISENLINAVFNTAYISICILDKYGNFVKVNKDYCKLLGYAEKELINQHYSLVTTHSNISDAELLFKKILKSGKSNVIETKSVKKNGEVIEVLLSSSVMILENGEKSVVNTVRDITESKHLRNLLDTTLETFKIAGWDYDILNEQFTFTKELYHIYDLEEGESLDETVSYSVMEEEEESLVRTLIRESIIKGEKREIEVQIITGKGKKKWIKITTNPIQSLGKTYELFGTVQDITEVKNTEEQMRQNEQLYKTLTRNFPGGTIDIIDRNFTYVFTGGKELEDLPQNPEEVIGKTIFEIYGVELAEILKEYFNRSFNGETITFDIEYKGKYWIATTVPLQNSEENINQIMLLTQNITEKRKADIGLKETHKSLSDFRKALDIASLVVITDRQGVITYVNENLIELSEYTEEEFLGQEFSFLFPDESERLLFSEGIKNISKGDVWQAEIKCTSKSGTDFWVNISVIPFIDNEGIPYQFLGVANDISERKGAEQKLKIQNQELTRINAELDRFVYSASHDLRAPLVSILGLLNIARLDASDSDNNAMYLDMMEKSVNKLDKFVQEIIDYSRNSRLEVKTEKIDFDYLINDIFDNLKYIDGADKVELKLNITGNSDLISDSGRIRVIFNNLLSNAVIYKRSREEQPFIHIDVDISAKEAKINVKDNGKGISKEYVNKIFDMFFRASNDGAGSGLGLYIVKESLTILGGDIKVESTQNVGSNFLFNVPNKIGE